MNLWNTIKVIAVVLFCSVIAILYLPQSVRIKTGKVINYHFSSFGGYDCDKISLEEIFSVSNFNGTIVSKYNDIYGSTNENGSVKETNYSVVIIIKKSGKAKALVGTNVSRKVYEKADRLEIGKIYEFPDCLK